MTVKVLAEKLDELTPGANKSEKLKTYTAALIPLLEHLKGTRVNFGAGLRRAKTALDGKTKLSEIVSIAANGEYFSLFEEVQGRQSLARGVAPKPTSWPFKDSLPGLVALFGLRGAGKTTYMTDTLNVDVIIRCTEPSETADLDPRVIQAVCLEEAFSFAFILLASGAKVAIDGLRELIYGGVGSTTSGGIDSNVYVFLTVMNNIAAAMGHAIVVTLNPMSEKQADEVKGAVASSLSGVIAMANGVVTDVTYRGADGRVFSGGGETEMAALSEKDLRPHAEMTLHGSLANQSIDAPILPFGPKDFEDDDLPRGRTGSRIVING